jgi:hypothetical protein
VRAPTLFRLNPVNFGAHTDVFPVKSGELIFSIMVNLGVLITL